MKYLIICFLILSACAAHQEVSAPPTDPRSVGIFGGAVVTQDSYYRSFAAVFVHVKDGMIYTCTITPFAPDFFLVNAHCITGQREQMKVIFYGLKVTKELLKAPPTKYVRYVKQVRVPDEFKTIPEHQNNPYDIAVVQLETPAPKEMQQFILSDQPVDPQVTPSLTILGYGLNGLIDEQQIGDQSLQVALQTVAPKTENYMITLDQRNDSGTCEGDSGGPVFEIKNGQYILRGITAQRIVPNGQRDQCRVVSLAVDISHWKNWILQTVENLKGLKASSSQNGT